MWRQGLLRHETSKRDTGESLIFKSPRPCILALRTRLRPLAKLNPPTLKLCNHLHLSCFIAWSLQTTSSNRNLDDHMEEPCPKNQDPPEKAWLLCDKGLTQDHAVAGSFNCSGASQDPSSPTQNRRPAVVSICRVKSWSHGMPTRSTIHVTRRVSRGIFPT